MAAVVDALGHPCLVLVEGEAGIGKTRLVREALAATEADRRVLVAACAPWRDPFPLGPVVVGLRRLWQRVGAVGLSPLGGALRPLFPEWGKSLPAAPEPLEDPKQTRHRLLCALTELVERLGVDVLVVEDAHWADTATLEWLLMLAADDGGGTAPSIVVAFRPTEVPEDSLLRSLTAHSAIGGRRVRVELEPLDVTHTRQLVGSMLHTDQVSTEFAKFLHDHADGIPLAVEETVRLMRERHDIVRQHGTWTRRVLDELGVPPAVRDSVLERVARLTPDARAVLRAASILGDQADETLLAAVAGVNEAAGQRGVTAALASGLLHEVAPGRYTFRHVLDSQAIESATVASERRRLHHRAAVALRGRDQPSVVRLARHFREAGDTEEWSRYAESAADLARDAGDDHTAVVTLLDVLNRAEHPVDRRVRLARKLAEAAFYGAGAPDELAHDVAAALRTVLDAPGLARSDQGELRLYLGRILWEHVDRLAAFEEMEAAIPDLGARADLAIHAMTNLALPVVPGWLAVRHRSWLDQAEEVAKRSGSPSDWRILDQKRATTLLLLGDEEGWAEAARLPTSGATPIEQSSVARTLLNVSKASMAWGRYDDSHRLLNAAVEAVESFDYRRGIRQAQVVEAYLNWFTGSWQGLRSVALAIAESAEARPRERLEGRQLVGLLDLAAGVRSRAARQLREMASEFARYHFVEPEDLAVPAALARLYLSEGSAEKARQETGPAMETVTRKGLWHWASDIGPVHMDALVASGELRRAAALVHDFAGGLAGRPAPAPAAALATCRAILAHAEGNPAAGELFGDAAEAWAVLPRPYDELLTRERQGRCLIAMNDQDQGVAVLTDAQQRLHRLGARWDADRIAQVLRDRGADLPRTNRRGPRGYGDQLSPRELQVMDLVARGMTNKEIGEHLFLSPKTVDVHLRSARRKLKATTRIGAAMAAAQAGLIGSSTTAPADQVIENQ